MLPTYNEAENLERLVGALIDLPMPLTVLIVDDQSPDGTGLIASRLAAQHAGRVIALHRTGERGRGLAGVEGFQRCLDLPVDVIVEMDADLSHDPADLPRLVAALASADVAVGSRYIAGGGEVGRPPLRRWISRFANSYLRRILGMRHRDCSSGYRAFRREILQQVDLTSIEATGPPILSEILWHMRHLNARIAEVPIVFQERAAGVSKLNWTILFASLLWPIRLRMRRFPVRSGLALSSRAPRQ